MGTRGLTVIRSNEREIALYSQYDTYPDGLGTNLLEFARALTDPEALQVVTALADRLVKVDESAELTPAEVKKVGKKYWQEVDTGRNWYAYLRACQGNLPLILESGYAAHFDGAYEPDATTWLEYSYLLDLNTKEFSAYTGSLVSTKVGAWKFDALPTDEEFVAAFEED